MSRPVGFAALILSIAATAVPAVAQGAPYRIDGVDAAAIFEFDPAGASGVPLTCDLVRSYLSTPIPKPSASAAQRQISTNRRQEAKAAKKAMLSDETIFAPLWEEQAFELKDGSVRPMTEFEKATIAELDALDAEGRTNIAQHHLSGATQAERLAYAEAVCGLLHTDVRLAGRDQIGYRKVDGDWKRFGGWRDGPDGKTLIELNVMPEALIALLRYELAQQRVALGGYVRNRVQSASVPTVGALKPF